MLYGELNPIISAMQARANQPRVPEEDEESLFEPTFAESDLARYPLEFETEQHFPVLMLSFLGPQHGRLFYACMHDGWLVIRQSKLYSFERRADAPVDLFTRFLLSRPTVVHR